MQRWGLSRISSSIDDHTWWALDARMSSRNEAVDKDNEKYQALYGILQEHLDIYTCSRRAEDIRKVVAT